MLLRIAFVIAWLAGCSADTGPTARPSVRDAGAREGGEPPDGGHGDAAIDATPTPSLGPVACGPSLCAAGPEACCADSRTCVGVNSPAAASCTALQRCDDSGDCPEGSACCATEPIHASTACFPLAAPGKNACPVAEVCREDEDCLTANARCNAGVCLEGEATLSCGGTACVAPAQRCCVGGPPGAEFRCTLAGRCDGTEYSCFTPYDCGGDVCCDGVCRASCTGAALCGDDTHCPPEAPACVFQTSPDGRWARVCGCSSPDHCPAGQNCCLDSVGFPTCRPDCSDATLACDGDSSCPAGAPRCLPDERTAGKLKSCQCSDAADCPQGTTCCGAPGQPSTCQDSCWPGFTLCASDADCSVEAPRCVANTWQAPATCQCTGRSDCPPGSTCCASPEGGITCSTSCFEPNYGSALCTSSSDCPEHDPTCLPNDALGAGAKSCGCRRPRDCPPGTLCCASFPPHAFDTTCSTSCLEFVVCETDLDCPPESPACRLGPGWTGGMGRCEAQ